MSLVDQNLVPFQRAYPLLIVVAYVAIAGSTGFVGVSPHHITQYSHTHDSVTSPSCESLFNLSIVDPDPEHISLGFDSSCMSCSVPMASRYA